MFITMFDEQDRKNVMNEKLFFQINEPPKAKFQLCLKEKWFDERIKAVLAF